MIDGIIFLMILPTFIYIISMSRILNIKSIKIMILFFINLASSVYMTYVYCKKRHMLPGKLTESDPHTDKYPEATGNQFITVLCWSFYMIALSVGYF